MSGSTGFRQVLTVLAFATLPVCQIRRTNKNDQAATKGPNRRRLGKEHDADQRGPQQLREIKRHDQSGIRILQGLGKENLTDRARRRDPQQLEILLPCRPLPKQKRRRQRK